MQSERVFQKKWYEKSGSGLAEVGKIFIRVTYFLYNNTVLYAPNREKTTSYLNMWAEAYSFLWWDIRGAFQGCAAVTHKSSLGALGKVLISASCWIAFFDVLGVGYWSYRLTRLRIGASLPYDIFLVSWKVVCDQVVRNIHEIEISSPYTVLKYVI